MKYPIIALVMSVFILTSCGTEEVVESNVTASPVVVEEAVVETVNDEPIIVEEDMVVPDVPDIVDIAISSPEHTTLVAAVQAWELVEVLKGEGPFTVFAPTDSAFSNLPEGTVESLLEPDNIAQLQWVLTYHVIPSKVMAEDLADWLVATTVQWNDLTFTYENEAWFVNGVAISTANLEWSNGVIHVVDGVLLPPTDS